MAAYLRSLTKAVAEPDSEAATGPSNRGGPRPGAGRPRIYPSGAARQAAYRARRRARIEGKPL
jgi:hypothetical protein